MGAHVDVILSILAAKTCFFVGYNNSTAVILKIISKLSSSPSQSSPLCKPETCESVFACRSCSFEEEATAAGGCLLATTRSFVPQNAYNSICWDYRIAWQILTEARHNMWFITQLLPHSNILVSFLFIITNFFSLM